MTDERADFEAWCKDYVERQLNAGKFEFDMKDARAAWQAATEAANKRVKWPYIVTYLEEWHARDAKYIEGYFDAIQVFATLNPQLKEKK